MKNVILNCFLLLISFKTFSQGNLVPNPSFEIKDTCPDDWTQFNYVSDWIEVYGTPEYFNKCSPTQLMSIPFNVAGYQQTISESDSGYAGLAIRPDFDFFREKIGAQLTDTFLIGQKYYVSFMFSCAYDLAMTPHRNRCFSNKLGIKFFTNPVNQNNQITDNTAHIFTDSILNDTADWKFFKGSIIADSAYTFFVIGNFFTTSNLSYYCDTSLSTIVYYYIDNVCISADSNNCYLTTNILNKNIEGFIIAHVDKINNCIIVIINDWNFKSISFEIFNNIGQLVTRNRIENETTRIDISTYNSGLYLLKIGNKVFKIFI